MHITSINKHKKNVTIVCLLALILGGIAVYAWLRYQNSAEVRYGSAATNPTADTPNSDDADNQGSASTSKAQSGEGMPPAPTVDSSIAPREPTGTFVSNHRPNLDGDPAPNTLTSTCTTTPGVDCYIRFTNQDTIKQLPTIRTDADGNVVWNWKLQDIGLTAGEWKITAVAVNGNNEASASDALSLVVEP